ncbi:MAG TPA: helix-turn-helix transcriptional regulator [Planctomycetaceae bacterium]
MVDRTPHRISAPLTEEGARRYADVRSRIDEVRRQVEADLPALMSEARRARAAHEAALAPARLAIGLLKAEREAQGVTLADLESRTGVPVSELRRLEDDLTAVHSLAMLNRYAAALGKRLTITLSDSIDGR